VSTFTALKNVTRFGDATLQTQLQVGLQYFFNWAFLGIGAFQNVRLSQSGQYSGSRSRLRPVIDPEYTDGQVWESFRKEWVWETGVEFSVQPINVSGVWVNSVFQPATGVGTNAHVIDYPNGRILFTSAISTTSTVEAEYSYKFVPFYSADEHWFQNVQFRSFHVEDSNFLIGSGIWGILATDRVQLPAVVIECGRRSAPEGLQLGGGHKVKQQIIFNVLTEYPSENSKLLDIIGYQQDKTIFLFDLNKLADSGVFPLDTYGSRVSNALMYPDLVAENNSYRWRKAFFESIQLTQPTQVTPNFYWSTAESIIEIEMP
jgi:hypothetical protein